MKIIVGLGNPGLRYRNTRHNAGFLAVDVIAKKNRISLRKKGYKGAYGVGRIRGEEVFLFKPYTYMNLSGEAVKSVFSSMAEEMQDLLVISDDVSLPLGQIRLRERGSSGGHNGLESIIEHIGPDFARLKLGVDSMNNTNQDMAAYVLAPFTRCERSEVVRMLEKASDCTETWLALGMKDAMNGYN